MKQAGLGCMMENILVLQKHKSENEVSKLL